MKDALAYIQATFAKHGRAVPEEIIARYSALSARERAAFSQRLFARIASKDRTPASR